MSFWVLYLVVLKATASSFSGFASVPIVREELVVKRQVLTDDELNAAVAISQTSPGPLGLYVVTVGYFVGGLEGAGAATAALATPAFLSIPVFALVRRHKAQLVSGASRGIVLASSVLMVFAALHLAAIALTSGALLLVFAGALIALSRRWLAPVWVVVAAALVGVTLATV